MLRSPLCASIVCGEEGNGRGCQLVGRIGMLELWVVAIGIGMVVVWCYLLRG
jgi:hypothetical protein